MKYGKKKKSPDELADEANEKFGMDIETEINPECIESEDEGVSVADPKHGECCEECKKSCRRNFWTQVLRTVTKVASIVLAAFGLSSFVEED